MTPHAAYTVRLDFAELSATGTGQRVFNVAINGATVLTNFDIYKAAGGEFKAISEVFVANADSTGSIAVQFSNGASESAVCNGIQILTGPTPVADVPPPGWAQDAVPTDPASDGGDAGPGASMDVSLPSGVEENDPGPDLVAYNSLGPSASYERMYRSALAAMGYASPGLSPGWVDNFDMRVIPGVSGSNSYVLYYPNDATEKWAVSGGNITPPSGAPYLASAPTSGTVTMTMKDRSVLTFTAVSPGSASGQYPTGTYLLTSIKNVVGHSITLTRDAAANNYRVLSVTNDASSPVTLLKMTYSGSLLSSVQDTASPSGSRQVNYAFTNGSLSSVSQISILNGGAPDHWRYAYQMINGAPFLSGVSAPSPADASGNTYAKAVVTYDPTGFVTAHTDANGNTRSYTNMAGGVGLQYYNAGSSANPILQQTQTYLTGQNVDSGFTDAAGHHAGIAYSGTPSPYLPSSVTNRNNQTTSIAYDTTNTYGNVMTITPPSNAVRTPAPLNYTYEYPAAANGVFPAGQLSTVQETGKQQTNFHYYSLTDTNGAALNGLLKEVDTPLPDTSDGHQSGRHDLQLSRHRRQQPGERRVRDISCSDADRLRDDDLQLHLRQRLQSAGGCRRAAGSDRSKQ